MSMNHLIIKGGYGEHGRSCFLMPFEENKYYMLDCGIMDTDPNPYPQVEPELLKKTQYLFLSHCHKDHSGAFEYFLSQGFEGWLVASRPTIELTGISYEKTIALECPGDLSSQICSLPDGLSISYGRSGHCVGSIWLHIFAEHGSLFYSGDYQSRPLVFGVDPIQDRHAGIAIVDCAHSSSDLDAPAMRRELTDRIAQLAEEGRKIIMPMPKYGRGLEIVTMLWRDLPDLSIGADEKFVSLTKTMLSYPQWLLPEAVKELELFLKSDPQQKLAQKTADVILLADPHLERPESRRLAFEEAEKGAAVLLTGRVKAGSGNQALLNEGKAFIMSYPHHQSRKDFLETIENNEFQTVLPFHNGKKEIFWG